MIEVDKISKRYGDRVAVDGLSFQVGKGEILGFLGPNGAGKTTTMRILSCYFGPTAGTARVAGFDVIAQPMEVKRRIGYLPEHPPLYREMTVEGFLAFAGRIRGIPGRKVRQAVGDAVERCGLEAVRHRIIGNLSKGYQQRVGLAQAILHNPDVLILDEPTIGLDPGQIKEIRHLIRSLGGSHSVILSTHILSEVQKTCDRIAIIRSGRLVATGTEEELASRFQGSSTLTVEIDGDATGAEKSFASIPGVLRVRRDDGDGNRFRLETESGRDIRAEVSRAVFQAGWALREFGRDRLSLEEIFIRLTQEESSPS